MGGRYSALGIRRSVPRLQREPLRQAIDNYIDNNRYWGNPNATDETDLFDRYLKDLDARNAQLQEQLKAGLSDYA